MKLRIAVTIGVVALLLYGGVVSASPGVVSPSAGPPGPGVSVIVKVGWIGSYDNMEELCTEADIIAVGTITAIKQVTGEPRGSDAWHWVDYSTDFVFTVEQVLKGPPNLEEVIVHQMGAHGKWEVWDDPMFNVGEQYVLFLACVGDGYYTVIGGPQGRFPIIEGKVYSMAYVLYPQLMNYHPKVVVKYLGIDCEWTLFYLNIKGIDKQAFAGRVIDAMDSGLKGYVAGSNFPYGETFPLQRALVKVHETWTYVYTDENGYFEIFLPPGTHTLTATYFTVCDETYDETYYNVQVVRGEFGTLTFVLEMEPMYVERPSENQGHFPQGGELFQL